MSVKVPHPHGMPAGLPYAHELKASGVRLQVVNIAVERLIFMSCTRLKAGGAYVPVVEHQLSR